MLSASVFSRIELVNKPLALSICCNSFAVSCKPTPCLPPRRYKLCLAGKSKCAVSGNDEEGDLTHLEPELMPKHVAVIMDGNRRWATNKLYPVALGHVAGKDAMIQLAHNCKKYGVKVLSVFAFSTENWARSQEEVDYLMALFQMVIQSEIEQLMREDTRVSFPGRKLGLPEALQKLISAAEERSKDKKTLHLMVHLNYGGRYDIIEATKKIASEVKGGLYKVEDINETVFEQHLETGGIEFGNPDLMIRTSGEVRVSNFMLWQLAYTEMFFTDKLFPDFNEADLVGAITAFQGRRRRFGGHNH